MITERVLELREDLLENAIIEVFAVTVTEVGVHEMYTFTRGKV